MFMKSESRTVLPRVRRAKEGSSVGHTPPTNTPTSSGTYCCRLGCCVPVVVVGAILLAIGVIRQEEANKAKPEFDFVKHSAGCNITQVCHKEVDVKKESPTNPHVQDKTYFLCDDVYTYSFTASWQLPADVLTSYPETLRREGRGSCASRQGRYDSSGTDKGVRPPTYRVAEWVDCWCVRTACRRAAQIVP